MPWADGPGLLAARSFAGFPQDGNSADVWPATLTEAADSPARQGPAASGLFAPPGVARGAGRCLVRSGRNWETHYLEGLSPQGGAGRVLSPAPPHSPGPPARLTGRH